MQPWNRRLPLSVGLVASTLVAIGLPAMADEHNCSLTNFEFDDVELRQPSPELAILTYTVTQDGECAGEALPEAVTSTAVYVRQEGEWKWASYQETPLE